MAAVHNKPTSLCCTVKRDAELNNHYARAYRLRAEGDVGDLQQVFGRLEQRWRRDHTR